MPKRTYYITRLVIQRSLAFIYFIGFLIIIHQFVALSGDNGILPARVFLSKVTFSQAPSLFWIHLSDLGLRILGWIGLALSLVALSGLSEKRGWGLSACVWGLMWLIYLSFVNIGYLFYGFGWESVLLEAGFLAIFFGANKSSYPGVVVWLMRWVLFRLMFGAGMIKIRGDACWTDLTCMAYHYETQPVPNPLSWFFHHMPMVVHKLEILFTHFVELIVPFGYFFPPPISWIAGGLTIFFQTALIFSGNLSWLNYVTIVLALSCFYDGVLKMGDQGRGTRDQAPSPVPRPPSRKMILYGLVIMVALLSIQPTINLFSSRQLMNASFNSLHLVNTYGAFGSVTKVRKEIIFLGTDEEKVTAQTKWEPYEFKCKPGDVSRAPCLMSPYHYRLDWQIWFAAMSPYQYNPWVFSFVAKLLENHEGVLDLIAYNPFPDEAPKYIKADWYEYRFSSFEERKSTGDWWVRRYLRPYLPPLSLDNLSFQKVLKQLQEV